CEYEPATGDPCDDHDPCTIDDSCTDQSFCAGELHACPIPPSPDGVCWNSNTCDGSGGCVASFALSSTTCNKDNKACTVADHCDGHGTCLAGSAKICSTPPNNQCYQPAGSCTEPSAACAYVVKAGSCNEGDACTYNDSCQP